MESACEVCLFKSTSNVCCESMEIKYQLNGTCTYWRGSPNYANRNCKANATKWKDLHAGSLNEVHMQWRACCDGTHR